ncbi:MAG: putative toxin-antitoxin system toxin component, PIN family [Anaerolineales bacterium]|nr:putative toxin-antitoxin system toxin component, PIN family [Anaerolineales bacterium]
MLDTNVIVSALLSSKGAPAQIIRHWEAGEFTVITSQTLITELKQTLTYPRVRKYLSLPSEDIEKFIEHLMIVAIIVDPQLTLRVIDQDQDDDRIVECAVAGKATYIVSGDSHLLDLGEYGEITILSPKNFLTVLQSTQKQDD